MEDIPLPLHIVPIGEASEPIRGDEIIAAWKSNEPQHRAPRELLERHRAEELVLHILAKSEEVLSAIHTLKSEHRIAERFREAVHTAQPYLTSANLQALAHAVRTAMRPPAEAQTQESSRKRKAPQLSEAASLDTLLNELITGMATARGQSWHPQTPPPLPSPRSPDHQMETD